MTRYLSLLRFTEAGGRAIKKSTARAAAFRKAAEEAGVKVEAQYWTVGAYDGVIVLRADEEKKVLRCLTDLAAGGYVRTDTLRAFDAEQFGAMVGK